MYVLTNCSDGTSEKFEKIEDIVKWIGTYHAYALTPWHDTNPPAPKVPEHYTKTLQAVKDLVVSLLEGKEAKPVAGVNLAELDASLGARAEESLNTFFEPPITEPVQNTFLATEPAPTDHEDAVVAGGIRPFLSTKLSRVAGCDLEAVEKSMRLEGSDAMNFFKPDDSRSTVTEDDTFVHEEGLKAQREAIIKKLTLRKNAPLQGEALREEVEKLELWFKKNLCTVTTDARPCIGSTTDPYGIEYNLARKKAKALYLAAWKLFLMHKGDVILKHIQVPESKAFECDLSEWMEDRSLTPCMYDVLLDRFPDFSMIIRNMKDTLKIPAEIKEPLRSNLETQYIHAIARVYSDNLNNQLNSLTLDAWVSIYVQLGIVEAARESIKSSVLYEGFSKWLKYIWHDEFVAGLAFLQILNQKVFTGILKTVLGLKSVRKADGVYWPGIQFRK